MKIVHIIFSMKIGGAETMLVDIVSRQCKIHETHLIIVNSVYDEKILCNISSDVKIHLINREPGSRSPLPILKLNILLRKIKPILVHAHNIIIINMLYKLLCGNIYNVVTIHGMNRPCDFLYKYDKIFAISNSVKNEISNNCNIYPVVIHNGVDFSKIRKKNKKIQFIYPVEIVQIGRLDHQTKGQHLLVKALRILREELNVDVNVTFIGDGPSKSYLLNLSRKNGVERYCKFAGGWSREKVYRNLCRFDILVQPSFCEGFGLAVVEGIAAGLPVVVSIGDGPAEVIQNGKYGWLVNKDDSSSIAQVIYNIIENEDQEQVMRKIVQAYNYCRSKFDINVTVQKYIEHYIDLCSNF